SFKTNTIAGSEVGLSTNLTYLSADLQMTNCGTRSVTLAVDFNTPMYTTFTVINGAWKQSQYSTFCGVGLRERTLSRGQTLTFTAVINPRGSFRIGVPYRTSNLKLKIQRFLPAWLLNHLTWLQRDPMVHHAHHHLARRPC